MELMFETSPSTEKLDAKLAAAQGEIEVASKDKVNPHFRSRYADITAVWEACRGSLAKHSVSVTQWPVHSDDGRLHIVTRVAHAGEWMRASFSVPVPKQDPQGYGSALTYCRRYALAAALGVVADEDDDGEGAVQGKAPPDAMRKLAGEAPQGHRTTAENGARGFSLNDLVPMGKHKGKRWGDLVELQPDYVEWAIDNLTRLDAEAKGVLRAALNGGLVGELPMPGPDDGLPF